MAVGEKLDALLKAKNKKPGTLASETGINKNTIYSIIKRNNEKVNYSIIEKISEALDVPVEYFFPSGTASRPSTYHPDMLPVSTHHVPILGSGACGEPIYKPGDGTEYIDVDDDLPCDFALIAQGDSMIGDRICDGDVVFFKAQDDVDDGQIAAVELDDGMTIKRIKRLRAPNGRVIYTQLLSSNKNYDSIDIGGPNETRTARIRGKAVAFKALLNQ